MKKLSRIAALLAASAMLFGFAACSDSDSGNPSPEEKNEELDSSSVSKWEFGDLQGKAAKISKADAEISDSPNATAVEALTEKLEAFPTHTETTEKLQYFYILEDVTYPATSGDKSMTILSKSDGSNYNFHNTYFGNYTSSSITETHSAGCLEIKGDALSIADVQGPFVVTIVTTNNGSGDKTDRYAYIKTGATLAAAIDAEPVEKASGAHGAGDTLKYTYSGTDKQTVVIGCGGGKSIRIFDVSVTEINTVVAVTGVTISSSDSVTELEKGGTTTLTATVAPTDATDKSVTWSIRGSDGQTATEAATIDSTGKVTAGTVSEATVVKVFATAGGVKSEAYSITIKAPAVVEGQATVSYFTGVSAENASYDAAGTSSDTTIVTAKDIAIAFGSGVDSTLFTTLTEDIYTTNSIKGYGVKSNKATLTANVSDTKADFVDANAEILTITATLTPVKNFTVQSISGQFVNGKSGNTLLFVNGTDTGLTKNKTLTLEEYKPATDIKGTAGTDLTIVFTIKANSSGVKQVSASDFQWTQVMNDIEIVVAEDK